MACRTLDCGYPCLKLITPVTSERHRPGRHGNLRQSSAWRYHQYCIWDNVTLLQMCYVLSLVSNVRAITGGRFEFPGTCSLWTTGHSLWFSPFSPGGRHSMALDARRETGVMFMWLSGDSVMDPGFPCRGFVLYKGSSFYQRGRSTPF